MTTNLWLTRADVPQIFVKAYFFFRAYFHSFLKIGLSILIPVEIIAVLATLLTQGEKFLTLVGQTILIIVTVGGQLWLNAALIYQALGFCLEEENYKLEHTLKASTKFITPLLIIHVVIILFILAISMIQVLILSLVFNQQSPLMQTLVFTSAFVAFLLIYPRLFLAPFFLIEESIRAGDALRKSNELTRLNRLKTYLVFLGFLLIQSLLLGLSFYSPVLSLLSGILLIPFTTFVLLFLYIDLKISVNPLEFEKTDSQEDLEI